MKWFISLLLVSNAMAGTKLYLKDACSGKQVSLLTPNGLNIELVIDDFDPREKMVIKAEYFPHTMSGEHINNAPVVYTYNYNQANGYRGIFGRRLRLPWSDFKAKLVPPKIRYLKRAEKRLKTSNLWMVRISWHQRGTNYGGVAQKSFIRLDSTKPFFEIKSAGMCHWETTAAVSSKIYVNEERGMKNVIRDYQGISQYSHYRGLSLGPNNNVGETPLNFENNLGWLYKDWSQSIEEGGTEQMQRKWILNRHESGVFGTRYSFTRKNVRRWEWTEGSGLFNRCKEYRPVSEGIMDIGVLTEDFYILPEEMYSTDEMNTFIENYRPTINTCGDSVSLNPSRADDIVTNEDKSIYYYYMKRELL